MKIAAERVDRPLTITDLPVIRAAMRGTAVRESARRTIGCSIHHAAVILGVLAFFRFSNLGLQRILQPPYSYFTWAAALVMAGLLGSAILSATSASRWTIPLNGLWMFVAASWALAALGTLVGKVMIDLNLPVWLVSVLGMIVLGGAAPLFRAGQHEFKRFARVWRWGAVQHPASEIQVMRDRIAAIVACGEKLGEGVLEVTEMVDQSYPLTRTVEGPRYLGLLSGDALILISKTLDDVLAVSIDGCRVAYYLSSKEFRVESDTCGLKTWRLSESALVAIRAWAGHGSEQRPRVGSQELMACGRLCIAAKAAGGQCLVMDGRETISSQQIIVDYALADADGTAFAIVVRSGDTERVITPWGEAEPHSEIKLDSLALSLDGTAVAYFAREARWLRMKRWRLFLDDCQRGSFVEPVLPDDKDFCDVGPLFLRPTDAGWRVLFWVRKQDWILVSREIRGRFCLHCQSPVHREATVCRKCRRTLPVEGKPTSGQAYRCPKCHTPVEQDAERCPGCGVLFKAGLRKKCPECTESVKVDASDFATLNWPLSIL